MPKDNSKNKQYSKEFKETILKRIESSNQSIPQISDELNISKSTIYQWIRSKVKNANSDASPRNSNPTGKWSSEDKFHIVLETYPLTEEELAAYCRRKGIFIDDVRNWKNQCVKANSTVSIDPYKVDAELKEEKQKIKNLEKELRFKDKALAETAALLVLRKKAQAIWGEPEGE